MARPLRITARHHILVQRLVLNRHAFDTPVMIVANRAPSRINCVSTGFRQLVHTGPAKEWYQPETVTGDVVWCITAVLRSTEWEAMAVNLRSTASHSWNNRLDVWLAPFPIRGSREDETAVYSVDILFQSTVRPLYNWLIHDDVS